MTREEAIETLGHVVPFATQNGEKIAEAIDMAIEALSAEYEDYEHATLVDIKEPLKVAVVRCKDCKWAEKAIFDEYCVECTMHHTTFMKHGFCNHGERREPTE